MLIEKTKKQRNNFIDIIRGIAFILMIIHHIYYFKIFPFLPHKIPVWVEYSGIISRNIFIILNGFVISKFNSRTTDIFVNALIISLYSYTFLPKQNFIYMGVLHYLSLSSFILMFLKKYNLQIVIILLGYLSYKNENYYFPIINNPADIFIPTRWFYKSVIGYLIGILLFYIPNTNSTFLKLNVIGKHSLSLYTLHMGLFMLLQKRFF